MNDHSGPGKPITEEEKRIAGLLKDIQSLTEFGEYRTLISFCGDEGLPPQVRAEARNCLLEAVFKKCLENNNTNPLHDIVLEKSLKSEIRWHAATELVEAYSMVLDGKPSSYAVNAIQAESGLLMLVRQPECPDGPRKAAGEKLLAYYSNLVSYTGLFGLATAEGAMHEIKKNAGLTLIRLAVKNGNYPILIKLESAQVTMDVRIALDGQKDAAALRSVSMAAESMDKGMLSEIVSNQKLSEMVRGRALDHIERLRVREDEASSSLVMRRSDPPPPKSLHLNCKKIKC